MIAGVCDHTVGMGASAERLVRNAPTSMCVLACVLYCRAGRVWAADGVVVRPEKERSVIGIIVAMRKCVCGGEALLRALQTLSLRRLGGTAPQGVPVLSLIHI